MPFEAFWFLTGLAIGLIIVGLIALGSYNRGYASARRQRFQTELWARRRAVVASSRRASLPPDESRASA